MFFYEWVAIKYNTCIIMPTTLRSENVIFSQLEKSRTEKYPSNRFNHLSTMSTSIRPSNMGKLKLTYALKGVVPRESLLDEDASLVGSCRRIWAKLSIITSLSHLRASSSDILKGSLAPSSFFSSTMGGHQVLRG